MKSLRGSAVPEVEAFFSIKCVVITCFAIAIDGRRLTERNSRSISQTGPGLAVWRAKPEAFREFDDWLFEPPQLRPLDQTKQHAAGLVGTGNLAWALSDEWITRQIHTNGSLYQANLRKIGSSMMPELMIGPVMTVMTFGPLNDLKDLYRILDQYLALRDDRSLVTFRVRARGVQGSLWVAALTR
jgi:hypothetical protein